MMMIVIRWPCAVRSRFWFQSFFAFDRSSRLPLIRIDGLYMKMGLQDRQGSTSRIGPCSIWPFGRFRRWVLVRVLPEFFFVLPLPLTPATLTPATCRLPSSIMEMSCDIALHMWSRLRIHSLIKEQSSFRVCTTAQCWICTRRTTYIRYHHK